MRGVCAELTLCGGETYAKVSNIGLQIYCVTAAPVIKAVRAFTPAVDYWVPARASPVEPGSLGRDDSPIMR